MSDVLERTLAGLRQALTISPQNGMLWLQIAEILTELGRQTEAAEAAKEALVHAGDEESRDRAKAIVAMAAGEDAGPADGNVLRLVRGAETKRDLELVKPIERERVTFADVGGLDHVKEEVRMKIILPFQKPDLFRAYGKKIGGGILLYGPPGCGKTLLARATAGECEADFLNVAIDSILDMWFGESERKLGQIFEEARRAAPAVLFLDEVEAIGGSRQQLRHSPGKTLVNQLLAEMDGAAGKNDRILVVAATNAPWYVDPALRRPGRFDRVMFVPPPDLPARLEVLRLHLRNRPAESIDLADLAKKTEWFSGADLHDLVERAADRALRDAMRTGDVRPMTKDDFKAALAQTKPTTLEWFATAKNYATFANTSGLYDDLTAYLDSHKLPRK